MSTIYIVSDNGKLQKKGETLQLHMTDDTLVTIFPFKTEQLIVTGNITITGSALKLLMRHNLDTIFLGKNGRFNGKLSFQESRNVFLRQKQFKLLDDYTFRVVFAKNIASGKLKNQLSFMQRINRKTPGNKKIEAAIGSVKLILKKVGDARTLEELRGYEGSGARQFFSVFKKNIAADWAVFGGRSMHPPKDNVNAVLSFLYTLLFFRLDSAIISEGLDSYVGYFHELNYGKKTLAFDLMEEYRTPVADSLCCALFNLDILKEEDFEVSNFKTDDTDFPLKEASGEEHDCDAIAYEECRGVLLTKGGLRKVIGKFEKKLETRIFFEPTGKHISYKQVIREQVKHIKRVINGEEASYKPLVSK